jgi:hypothetical protein
MYRLALCLPAILVLACVQPPPPRTVTPSADSGERPIHDTGVVMMSMDARPALDSGTPQTMDAAIEDAHASLDAHDVSDSGPMPKDSGHSRPDVGPLRDAGQATDAGASACTMNSDCLPGGWCRPTQRGSNACTPWQTEGGICGGFVIPYTRERCDSSHACLQREPFLADATGICVLEATAQELEANPTTYSGHVVGIREGFIVAGSPPSCTRRGCPRADMCCNDCSAGQFIATSSTAGTGLQIISSAGQAYTCNGNECTDLPNRRILYSDNCSVPAGRYRIIGDYTAGPPAQFQVRYTPAMYP